MAAHIDCNRIKLKRLFHKGSSFADGWMLPKNTMFAWYALPATLCLALMFFGCSSGPARIYAISVDPSSLSKQVLADFDMDSSGTLSSVELEKLPPIHQNWSEYDTDKNNEISAAELEARFKLIFNPDVGLVPASCSLTRNGRPISGAEVRFVPPKFLEGILPVAHGVTDDNGSARLNLDPDDMPKSLRNTRIAVMRPGIYFVEVTHPKLTIPSQYNTQTQIGKEVSSEVLKLVGLPIDLKF